MISSSFEFCLVLSFCNQVRELSILKISVESRALLSCYVLEKIERIKRNKRVHIDLMDSNNFTHRKYEA